MHWRQATQLAFDNGRSATEVHASDLTLDSSSTPPLLAAAPNLLAPERPSAHQLAGPAPLGFFGSLLMLEWLDRMDLVNGSRSAWSAPDPTRKHAPADATFG